MVASCYGQVARMREGRPLASERFGTRLEAQDAATSAFVLAIQLQPTNGQIWFDLGTSLFFAGELDTGRPSSPSEGLLIPF